MSGESGKADSVKAESDKIAPEALIEALGVVLQKMEEVLDSSTGWEEEQIGSLNQLRDELTAKLYDELPHPLPPALESNVKDLKDKTQSLAGKIQQHQDNTQKKLVEFQRQRTAQGAYKSIGKHV